MLPFVAEPSATLPQTTMATTKEQLAAGVAPYDYTDPNRKPLAPRMIPGWRVVEALDNAGFPESEWVTGTAVCRRESSFVPDLIGAVNSSTRGYDPENASWDFGLWQISYKWHEEMLLDPQYTWTNPTDNARMAKRLFDGSVKTHGAGMGWRPWHTYTSGNYAIYIDLAKDAVAEYKLRKTPPVVVPPKPPVVVPPVTAPPKPPVVTPPKEVLMGQMSGAEYKPLSGNHTSGGNNPRVVVVHTIEGSLMGADSWFRNSSSRVSAHFGVGKNGRIIQWVNTNDRAWANVGANSYSISIENEGTSSEGLTDAQIESNAKILAFAHVVHEVPLAYVKSATGSGLGYHSQFPAWSLGGTGCPGPRKVAQLPKIMARAAEIVGGATPAPPVTSPGGGTTSKFGPEGSVRSVGSQQKEVNLAGYSPKLVQDSTWGPATEAGVRWYQGKLGVTADGVWGPATDAAHHKRKNGTTPAPKPTTPKPTPSKDKLTVNGSFDTATVSELQRALNEGRF